LIEFGHILVARSGWRHYGYREYTGVYFESNSREAWGLLTGTAVLVVGILLWHVFASRRGIALRSNSPKRLFRELCRAHSVDRAGRRLLKRLAAARGVAPAALLFVRPECFATTDLPSGMSGHADEIARLEEVLFAHATVLTLAT
jgi:hypothetical protein